MLRIDCIVQYMDPHIPAKMLQMSNSVKSGPTGYGVHLLLHTKCDTFKALYTLLIFLPTECCAQLLGTVAKAMAIMQPLGLSCLFSEYL